MKKIELIAIVKLILMISVVYFANGCAPYLTPAKTSRAKLGAPTPMHKDLKSLPETKEKIVAAVYKFRDQTGQYKQTANGTSFSTAVTQGATSILLRSLEESGWFAPIEREGLSNLLNERKIIRSSRANYKGENGEELSSLPPLLYAGVILEGGIIAYDTNVMTGGVGAKYFGVGGSTQYRQDRVTIYLRAISTKNGRILKTVYTTKTILSQLVDIGVYRFVNFKRLLEVETGFSYNEPPEMCVTEAIEKAVFSLIIEGIFEGLWELKNPDDMQSPVIRDYFKEKEQIARVDEYELPVRKRRSAYSIGLNLAAYQYSGDYASARTKPAVEFRQAFQLSPRLAFALNIGRGMVSGKEYFETYMNVVNLKGIYYLFPYYQFTPYLLAGGGAVNVNADHKNGEESFIFNKWLGSFVGGLGMEYFLSNRFSVDVALEYNYMFNDQLDGVVHGKLNDYFWSGRAGLTFYLGF